ncbi:MAG: ROK family transcriptional regulator [Alphaproteobacteria bacterium]|nr:ROK family transcriptional regulator [Alphaproteobacteria bacterium]
MGLRGTNQEFGRPYNRRLVLETIRLHGPIARAEIARRVGLTVQTVSNIIRELDELDFVIGARAEPRGRGYPATNLTINPQGGLAIGVHVTPWGVELALVNLAGEIVRRDARRKQRLDPEAAFGTISEMLDRRPSHIKGRVLGAGLAMPGPFDVESMSFVGPTTLEGWKGVPVQRRLAELIGRPSFIEMDHAAAALGERLYGEGRRFRDFYYLYFGVGLGGCMVQDGQTLRGSFGNAGEIGHLPLVPDGEPCPCGNRGCLERYVSLEAYERRARSTGLDGWCLEAVPLLRSAIAIIENLFDPETVIVGGGTDTNALAQVLARLEPLPNSISQRRHRTAPRVIPSASGPDAVLRGAAALAIAGVLSPRSGTMFGSGEAGSIQRPVEAA